MGLYVEETFIRSQRRVLETVMCLLLDTQTFRVEHLTNFTQLNLQPRQFPPTKLPRSSSRTAYCWSLSWSPAVTRLFCQIGCVDVSNVNTHVLPDEDQPHAAAVDEEASAAETQDSNWTSCPANATVIVSYSRVGWMRETIEGPWREREEEE